MAEFDKEQREKMIKKINHGFYLEGMEMTAFEKYLDEKYISGEITISQRTALAIEHAKKLGVGASAELHA